MKKKKTQALFIRSFIFGVEDSLVSTGGLISGIAAANVPRFTILLTGAVLLFVEAFSMGVGSFLSETSAEEFTNDHTTPMQKSILGGVLMFISYFIAGFVPLGPYVFVDTSIAFPLSIVLSLIALYLLGAVSAKHFKKPAGRSGFRMLLIGGFAIIAGVVVGQLVQNIEGGR